jgi:hypothetical protein
MPACTFWEGNTDADADGLAVDHRLIKQGPAIGIEVMPLGPTAAMGQLDRPHPAELDLLRRAIDDPAQAGQIQLGSRS